MHNVSLVCFTLLVQGAIGLAWFGIIVRWMNGGLQADYTLRPMAASLVLAGLGLLAALAHLSKPRLAPKALRNLTASWLSREVALVPVFTVAVVLVIMAALLDMPAILVVLEIAACLLGGAALYAMTRVYFIKTVPMWRSPATPLEFAGSALLMGCASGAVLTSLGVTDHSAWNPGIAAAGTGIILGLVLKVSAIKPALSAERKALDQCWYLPAVAPLSTGRVWVVRMGLNLFCLAAVLAAMTGADSAWLWSCLSMVCLGTGEVIGRMHFYKAYIRIGL